MKFAKSYIKLETSSASALLPIGRFGFRTRTSTFAHIDFDASNRYFQSSNPLGTTAHHPPEFVLGRLHNMRPRKDEELEDLIAWMEENHRQASGLDQ